MSHVKQDRIIFQIALNTSVQNFEPTFIYQSLTRYYGAQRKKIHSKYIPPVSLILSILLLNVEGRWSVIGDALRDSKERYKKADRFLFLVNYRTSVWVAKFLSFPSSDAGWNTRACYCFPSKRVISKLAGRLGKISSLPPVDDDFPKDCIKVYHEGDYYKFYATKN